MNWEKNYLKVVAFWLLMTLAAIILLYFDRPTWAIVMLLSYLAYNQIVLILAQQLMIHSISSHNRDEILRQVDQGSTPSKRD